MNERYRIGQCQGCGKYTALENNYCEKCNKLLKPKNDETLKDMPEDLRRFLGL